MDNRQDRIDRYIKGQMNDDMRHIFEAEMASDSSLRDDVDKTRRLLSPLGTVARSQQSFARWESQRKKNVPTGVMTKANVLWSIASFAAAACLVIGFFLITPSDKSDDLAYSAFYDSPTSVKPNHTTSKPNGTQMKGDPVTNIQDHEIALSAEIYTGPSDDLQSEINEYELKWCEINRMIKHDSISEVLPVLMQFAEITGKYQDAAKRLITEIKDGDTGYDK